jgi:hypothetical protein
VIRLVVMMYVRFPLSLRNVEDLLFERGLDICHETVRMWWNRFGPMFAGDIRRQRVSRMRGFRGDCARGTRSSGWPAPDLPIGRQRRRIQDHGVVFRSRRRRPVLRHGSQPDGAAVGSTLRQPSLLSSNHSQA